MFRLRNVVIGLLIAFSCSRPLPELEGFDRDAWVTDKAGCLLKRAPMASVLEQNRNKLLTLDEMQIISVLGKPDHNELYKRNQKFFYYYIDPGPGCIRPDSTARRVIVRFNAMGLAKEITIDDESPN